jgi:hypothetical protein
LDRTSPRDLNSYGWGIGDFGETLFGGVSALSPHDTTPEPEKEAQDLPVYRVLTDHNCYDNVLLMPNMPKFDENLLVKISDQLNRRKEEVYVVRDHRIIWMNQSAAQTTPHAVGTDCHSICTVPEEFCEYMFCHQLRAPYIAPACGRAKMFFPFYVAQEVRGFVVLKFKGSKSHGNYAGPVPITV